MGRLTPSRDVWHSVLWLLRFPPYGEPHVKAEAAARGVDPARIIFTDVAAKPIHIARSGAACASAAALSTASAATLLPVALLCGLIVA